MFEELGSTTVGNGLNDAVATFESALAFEERREWYDSGLFKAEPKSDEASDMATSMSISKPGKGIDLCCLAKGAEDSSEVNSHFLLTMVKVGSDM